MTSTKKSRMATTKYNKASTSLKRKFQFSLSPHFQEIEAGSSKKEEQMQDIERYEMIMDELKEEFQTTTSYQRKLQILSLSPFTITRTQEFFDTTRYMVDKSRSLKKKLGILPEVPRYTKGKKLTADTISKVKDFYEDDEVSRMCAGKSECVSTGRNKDTGEKEYKQKRLILGNLKEIYAKFRETEVGIGFSSFASLRPKWCVIAGAKGTHSVCVCTYHQNPKLMVSAIGEKDITYHTLIEKCVCNIKSSKCMLHRCLDCPGSKGVVNFLDTLLTLTDRDIIEYAQWTTTDRSTLQMHTESTDEFIESLSDKIYSLTRHHYIAQCQSQQMKTIKENLQENEVLVLGDFAENYSFITQDAPQSFHWTNDQATLHPFVVYYKNNGVLMHISYCIVSDCLEHSTSAVHSFQNYITKDIKVKFPNLEKIIYFSDGCGGQYKNRYNFINLCHHKQDFGVKAEWNFFATSHGKNACDGIGGMVKRGAAKASLQRINARHILTPKALYNFCTVHFNSIHFFFVPKEEIEANKVNLSNRFKKVIALKGTRSFHRIVPISMTAVHAYQTSNSEEYSVFSISSHGDQDKIRTPVNKFIDYDVGQYVACRYEQKTWLGIIKEVSEEFDDFNISFLRSSVQNKYTYPEKEDLCWIKRADMIQCMSSPDIIPGIKISYKFHPQEINSVQTV